jgi:hypothetical protein
MRKIYVIFCVLILIGCSKKKDVSPSSITITYSLSGNNVADFGLSWVDPNIDAGETLDFSGKSWSKSFTINNINSYANGYVFDLKFGAITPTTGENYTLAILINNKVVISNAYNSLYNEGGLGYSYVISH